MNTYIQGKYEFSKKEMKLIKQAAKNIYYKYCLNSSNNILSMDDLRHWGIIGLISAYETFDSERKIPFQSYAIMKINWAIMDHVRKIPLIRIPQQKYSQVKVLRQAIDNLKKDNILPVAQALAEYLGWSLDKVHKIQDLAVSLVDIDDKEKVSEFADPIPEKTGEDIVMEKELSDIMQKCLEAIEDAAKRLILVSRVLNNMTLDSIAKKFDCSRQTVSNKQKQAEQEMKECLKINNWTLE